MVPNDSFCIPVYQPERFGSEVMSVKPTERGEGGETRTTVETKAS